MVQIKGRPHRLDGVQFKWSRQPRRAWLLIRFRNEAPEPGSGDAFAYWEAYGWVMILRSWWRPLLFGDR